MTPEASCSNVGGGAPKPFLVLAARCPLPAFLAAKPDERLNVAARHVRMSNEDIDDTIVVETEEVTSMLLTGDSRPRNSAVKMKCADENWSVHRSFPCREAPEKIA